MTTSRPSSSNRHRAADISHRASRPAQPACFLSPQQSNVLFPAQLARRGKIVVRSVRKLGEPVSRVFVVEDMRRMRGLLSELFDSLGDLRMVGSASTEAEADLWLDEHPGEWDLAVIDLLLEQGSGMGVVARCRSRHPAGKVVVLSSYATPGVRKHCLSLGADVVFHKGQSADFVAYCAELAGHGPAGLPQL